MARAADDIIQRIVLNGQQFSSETNRIYADLEAGARNVAERTKNHFETSFQNIQQLAAKSLAMPANAKGVLNLDVAGAREGAAAAEAQAKALRLIATAAETAAQKQNDTSESTRIYVQAARAAATEAENGARAALQQANALDLLQNELNQTAGATELAIERNRLLERSTRGGGMAAMQAGQQFQDFTIQVQGGQNPLVAATQQLSQLGAVLYHTEGAAGKFGRFLAGGWGTMLFIGIAVLTTLIAKFTEAGDEIAKETEELEKNAAKTRAMEAAKAAYARTADGLIAKIREEHAEMEKLNRTTEQNLQLRYQQQRQATRDSQTALTKGVTDLSKAYGELTAAEVKVDRLARKAREQQGAAGEAVRGQLSLARQELADKQADVRKLEEQQRSLAKEVENSRELERNIRADAIDAKIQQGRDAEKDATDRLTASLQLLRQERVRGEIGEREYARRAKELTDAKEAEVKRIREREKARQDAERNDRKAERSVRLLDPTDGGRVTSGVGSRSAPLPGASTNHRGIDIAVPVGTGVRAGATGVVVSVGNMGKLGKAVVVDYGDKVIATYGHLSEILVSKGQTVRAGETIARSGNTGNSTGPHLHYGVTKDGRTVDPRRVTVREGAGDKAADVRAANDNKAAEKLKEKYDRILATSQKQLDVEAESLRFIGLKVQGLDEQMAVEMDIAKMAREHAERMAELTPAQRAEQEKIGSEFLSEAILLRQQADTYANLREQAGDLSTLTGEQKQALDAANLAMIAQLENARALAKTAAERNLLEQEIARAKARVAAAEKTGDKRGADYKRAAEELKRDEERSERERYERQQDQIYSLADLYRSAMDGGSRSIVENFRDEMKDAIAEIAARYTLALITGQKNVSLGSILGDMGAQSGVGGGGLLGGLLGALGKKKQADFASSLMPGIGDAAGAAKAGGLLGGLGGVGSAISSALPYAAIAMAVLPIITSLFASPKWGSASLSLNGGVVSGAQGVGKGASQIKAATGNAGSVAEGINRLAEQLGATITSIPGVTIGTWDGKARVALTSTTDPLHAKSKAGKAGLIKDFGEGGEREAIQYAIQYAFTNAALEGISQASKNIIKAGGDDVASAITKALLIEDIPKRLQAIVDPVGYAVDTFNKGWEKTIAALKEGGASAEQMAEAQKLYKLELEQTKASAREASADLKDFLKGLNMGSASPYSTRDQERMAYEAFKPFEEAILRGERVDQGKFTEAAQTWLDLQRQLFGSTGAFFDAMDKVQSLTNKAIGDIDNAKPIRVETDPWVKAGATASQASADLLDQVSRQTAENTALLARIAAAVEGSGGSFMNEQRNYA